MIKDLFVLAIRRWPQQKKELWAEFPNFSSWWSQLVSTLARLGGIYALLLYTCCPRDFTPRQSAIEVASYLLINVLVCGLLVLLLVMLMWVAWGGGSSGADEGGPRKRPSQPLPINGKPIPLHLRVSQRAKLIDEVGLPKTLARAALAQLVNTSRNGKFLNV